MKTRIFIADGTALIYGNNKATDGVDTALSPYDLQEGTIGVYGVHKDGSTNYGKMVLITDGGSEAAGKVPAANFVGDQIYVCVGKSTGMTKSGALDIATTKCNTQAPVAGTKQAVHVGYTSTYTSNLLNEPSAIYWGDEAMLGISNPLDVDKADQAPNYYSGQAIKDSDNMFDIITRLAEAIYDDDNRIVDVAVQTDLTGTTAVANSATCTVVHGSPIVTTSADAELVAGDYVEFVQGGVGDTYKVLSDEGAGGFTLDSPFRGTSATIANADSHDQGATAPTEVGVIVTDKTVGVKAEVSVGGIIQSANKTVATEYIQPINTGVLIREAEERNRAKYGAHDVIDRRTPIVDLTADISANYDTYFLQSKNMRLGSDPHNSDGNGRAIAEVMVCFESTTADSGNTHQSNFEDVLASLGITVNSLY